MDEKHLNSVLAKIDRLLGDDPKPSDAINDDEAQALIEKGRELNLLTGGPGSPSTRATSLGKAMWFLMERIRKMESIYHEVEQGIEAGDVMLVNLDDPVTAGRVIAEAIKDMIHGGDTYGSSHRKKDGEPTSH